MSNPVSHAVSEPLHAAELTARGKSFSLRVLGTAPFVAETPAALLDDDTTPIAQFYVRDNGLPPPPAADPGSWELTIDGAVLRPLTLTLDEIKDRFAAMTYRLALQCGGNGRALFTPPGQGNPWTHGGVGCAEWTGVPLRALLRAVRPTPDAGFTGHHGADTCLLAGIPGRPALSRGMPIAKAWERHTLLAWAMNGETLPHAHGGPLRLIVPGWVGSLSQKWLRRIEVRTTPHDGPGMGGLSYRVPVAPLAPGEAADASTAFRDLEAMPVRSVITSPVDGAVLPAGTRSIAVRGAAWGGDVPVSRVDVSKDGGATWQRLALAPARNRYDWRRFAGEIALPGHGYFEIMARATDRHGVAQPFVPIGWNPEGYGANPMHRIAIRVPAV